MKRSFIVSMALFSVLVLATFAGAQSQSANPQQPVASPNDYSGMYSFLHDGEFVQINMEQQGKVTGYISRLGELPSDRGAFLDQFFKTGKSDGNTIAFTTEPVHSTWYEFTGVIERGQGKTPNDDGYYLITGKLTKYTQDANKKTAAESREATFKSFGQQADIELPKRD
ncbi:MAG TPA: hypothetical protein VFM10_10850 [Terriglobales bacterium]|nr:hypothetical protein [Terriglobales bacterium]